MISIRYVQRAIEFEIERQITAVENGETLTQETRSYDALKNTTISMRSKEAANDYRFFPEPDLQPITVTQEDIEAIKLEMPALPRDLFIKYTSEFKLSEYDAGLITDNKDLAAYYENIVAHTNNYKGAVNVLMGDVKSYINQKGLEITEFSISGKTIAELVELIQSGKISSSTSSQKLFPAMLENPTASPLELAQTLNLLQDSDESSVIAFIDELIEKNPDEVARYKSGEKQLFGFLMGQFMKISKGKADPKSANKLIRQKLEE